MAIYNSDQFLELPEPPQELLLQTQIIMHNYYFMATGLYQVWGAIAPYSVHLDTSYSHLQLPVVALKHLYNLNNHLHVATGYKHNFYFIPYQDKKTNPIIWCLRFLLLLLWTPCILSII